MARIVLFICLIFAPILIFGQNDTIPPTSLPKLVPTKIKVDTLSCSYFFPSNPYRLYALSDTTLSDFLHHVDPALARSVNHLNLGNVGSATQDIYYHPATDAAFDFGLNQYALYNYTLENFKFYKSNIPFSDLAFSPVGGQQNFVVKGDFARSFNDGFSFSLNYRRIKQSGFYSNQDTKTTNLGVGIAYLPEDSRSSTYFTLLSNSNDENNNGGISTDQVFNEPFNDDRTNIPVYLSAANTRHQELLLSLSQHFKLLSLDSSSWQINLSGELQYSTKYFKFSDPDVKLEDSIYYQDFLVDLRGLRTHISYNKLTLGSYIYALRDRLKFRAGISFDRYNITQDPVTDDINDIHLLFDGSIPIYRNLDLISKGSLGIGSNAGSFEIDGKINLKLGDWLDIRPGITFYRQRPQFIQNTLFINELKMWDNDYSNYFGSSLYGFLSIPRLGLSATLSQHVEDNTIYWNDTGRPVQFEDVYTTTQVKLEWKVKWGILRFDHYGLWQKFNENLFHLPELFSKHDLSIEGHLFGRKMLARLGVEATLIPQYKGLSYQPLSGQFIPSEKEVPFYPLADIYFSAKIQQFRIFITMQNSTSYFRNDIFYRVLDYPQFDRKLRFGIRWQIHR